MNCHSTMTGCKNILEMFLCWSMQYDVSFTSSYQKETLHMTDVFIEIKLFNVRVKGV